MDPSPTLEGGGDATRYQRPRLPWIITATSLVVAVGAVSLLIFILYRQTTGPGEVARDFVEGLQAGDCERVARVSVPGLAADLSLLCDDFQLPHGSIDVVDVRTTGSRLDRALVLIRYADPDGPEGCLVEVRLVREDEDWLVIEWDTPGCPAQGVTD